MYQKVKIPASFTETRRVEVEITERELVKAALQHFTVDDTIVSLKNHLERKFRENDPTLPPNAEINWFYKTWEIFSYVDYHKNDDVYKTLRDFNEDELQYCITIESVIHVLNN